MRFGRRPQVNLVLDVVLRNTESSPRWFVLPSSFGPALHAAGPKDGVDALEVFTPEGSGHVVIGRFLGTAGFQALLLPAHAELRLRRLPISYWGELPDSINIDVVIAKQVLIGGERGETWFGDDPQSSVTADIVEDAENPMRISHSKRTPDNKEVTIAIEEERRVRVRVLIKT